MPVADPSFGWQEAAAAFAIISVVAFLVTWVVTDLGRVSRTPYVAILALTTFALAGGYLAWSGTSVVDLVTDGWAWGLLGGVVAAALLTPLVRRLPARPHPGGAPLVGRFLWEGVVYGTAEAILLATLPVLAIWQATDALGWTDTGRARALSGAFAVAGALFVIAVHHLGYREFRQRASRKILAGALAGCGIQALAFLLTGNVLAPVVAHIVLHWQLTLRGNEMPPVSKPQLQSPDTGRPRTEATAPGSSSRSNERPKPRPSFYSFGWSESLPLRMEGELQPNIDGLSRDEALLAFIPASIAVSITWAFERRHMRHRPGHAT